MRSRSTLGLAGFLVVAACVVTVPLAFGSHLGAASAGNAKAGKKIFVAFCGRCHTMAAAGSHGTLGPNLDEDHVSYTRVVTAVEEGVGGIQAEYILRSVTFDEVYDVAKFVTTARQGPSVGHFSAGSP